jgi:hypothetical protein
LDLLADELKKLAETHPNTTSAARALRAVEAMKSSLEPNSTPYVPENRAFPSDTFQPRRSDFTQFPNSPVPNLTWAYNGCPVMVRGGDDFKVEYRELETAS